MNGCHSKIFVSQKGDELNQKFCISGCRNIHFSVDDHHILKVLGERLGFKQPSTLI